ncbi:MAG: nucleoside recognition protein [Clostridium sp.]|nr:nucleoside recognition protein [Clostridium sp.]MCM1208348.1 nucleoside recognition protein [Ruminococcus sp.]
MLDYIWAFMIIAGVIFGGFQGAEFVNLVAGGAIDSAKEAIELCIVMLGVVGLWNGIMNIAKESGLITKWTKGIDPAISFLFPNIPKQDAVRQDIAMNMIANMLGLGWAATPAGLRAMKGLKRLEEERMNEKKSKVTAASNEMCTLIVLNISSLQLIPVNIIAYRSQYGSTNPTAVIGPGLVATSAATLVAIIFCKLLSKGK